MRRVIPRPSKMLAWATSSRSRAFQAPGHLTVPKPSNLLPIKNWQRRRGGASPTSPQGVVQGPTALTHIPKIPKCLRDPSQVKAKGTAKVKVKVTRERTRAKMEEKENPERDPENPSPHQPLSQGVKCANFGCVQVIAVMATNARTGILQVATGFKLERASMAMLVVSHTLRTPKTSQQTAA